MRPVCAWVVLAAAVGSFASSGRAGVVTLGPSKDNTLYDDPFGAFSNALGTHFFAGTTTVGLLRRGLLGFDVAATVPAGSVIVSASLTLHMSRTSAGTEPISLHRVLADWGEGTSMATGEEGNGTLATPGDATWVHRFFETVFWATPGGDFDPASSADLSVASEGFYTWGSTASMVADVQGWLDGTVGNFGWLVQGEEAFPMTAKRFDTRENADPAVRPSLTIEYIPVPAPAGAPVLGIWLVAACRRRRSGTAHPM